jgi:hypothetical protein
MSYLRHDGATGFARTEIVAHPPCFEAGGLIRGPRLAVFGSGRLIDGVSAKLSALPTLPYLRGELALFLQGFESADIEPGADAKLDLSHNLEVTIQTAYWQTLACATRLGMIAGRGIPQGYLTTPPPFAFSLVAPQNPR